MQMQNILAAESGMVGCRRLAGYARHTEASGGQPYHGVIPTRATLQAVRGDRDWPEDIACLATGAANLL